MKALGVLSVGGLGVSHIQSSFLARGNLSTENSGSAGGVGGAGYGAIPLRCVHAGKGAPRSDI